MLSPTRYVAPTLPTAKEPAMEKNNSQVLDGRNASARIGRTAAAKHEGSGNSPTKATQQGSHCVGTCLTLREAVGAHVSRL